MIILSTLLLWYKPITILSSTLASSSGFMLNKRVNQIDDIITFIVLKYIIIIHMIRNHASTTKPKLNPYHTVCLRYIFFSSFLFVYTKMQNNCESTVLYLSFGILAHTIMQQPKQDSIHFLGVHCGVGPILGLLWWYDIDYMNTSSIFQNREGHNFN